MSAEAAFYNNFDVWTYFFRQKKNDKDIDFYFVCLCAYQGGESGRTISFLVHLLKFESDTATSKDIAILNFF